MGNASSNLQPYFTSNSGSSWSACTFSGGNNLLASSAGWLAFAQDSTSPGKVILLGNGKLTTGYWESNSTTSCAFTLQTASLPDGLVGHIVAVPGKPAHSLPRHKLITTGAFRGLERPIRRRIVPRIFGSAIAGVNSIIASGLGAANPNHDGFPAFYYQGYYNNGVTNPFGLYEVDNIDGTPIVTSIDTADNGFPSGNFDFLEFIQGDTATYGTIYGGFGGSGGFYRTLN